MGIHFDLSIRANRWQTYFYDVIETIKHILAALQQYELLADSTDLTIWEDVPVESLGGKQRLHMPPFASVDSGLLTIEKIIREKFKITSENTPYFLQKEPPVSIRIEGHLSLKLPLQLPMEEGRIYTVPFEILSAYRLRKLQGSIYLRIYDYYGLSFEDLVTGSESEKVWNRNSITKCLAKVWHDTPTISRIIVGIDPSAYENTVSAILVYERSIEKYLEDVINSAKIIKRKSTSEEKLVPEPLDEKDLKVLTIDITPLRKNYLIRQISNHPYYKVDLPLQYQASNIAQESGSILLYQKDFLPMKDIHASLLKAISIALQRASKPKEEFDKDFQDGLDEVRQKLKNITYKEGLRVETKKDDEGKEKINHNKDLKSFF